MQKLGRAFLVLAAGLLLGLALVASATGTTEAHAAKVRHLQVPVAALAMDGSRIAYDASARYATKPNATNKVLIWDVRTGKTVKVSGKKTAAADSTSTGGGVFQLAIAGSRVAWLVNEGGNLEGDDYLFTSSVKNPRERTVASVMRTGDNCPGREAKHCAGPWLGGLVGSGNLIAANRWTTDGNGVVTAGELDVLSGTRLKRVATGANTVRAASVNGGRIVVSRTDGTVAVYSASGSVLLTVTPPSAKAVALGGHNLVVLTNARKLAVYDTRTAKLRKTLPVHGAGPQNLDVQGNIAIYTTGSSVRAVNLSSAKDRAVGRLQNRIAFACIDGAGLAYAGNGTGKTFGKGTVAFVPFARVKAAVG